MTDITFKIEMPFILLPKYMKIKPIHLVLLPVLWLSCKTISRPATSFGGGFGPSEVQVQKSNSGYAIETIQNDSFTHSNIAVFCHQDKPKISSHISLKNSIKNNYKSIPNKIAVKDIKRIKNSINNSNSGSGGGGFVLIILLLLLYVLLKKIGLSSGWSWGIVFLVLFIALLFIMAAD